MLIERGCPNSRIIPLGKLTTLSRSAQKYCNFRRQYIRPELTGIYFEGQVDGQAVKIAERGSVPLSSFSASTEPLGMQPDILSWVARLGRLIVVRDAKHGALSAELVTAAANACGLIYETVDPASGLNWKKLLMG
jgi:hypothetical protein